MSRMHAIRSVVARTASTTAVLVVLTGCASADPQAGPGEPVAEAPVSSAAPSASAGDPSVSTVDDACARVLDTVRTAPEQLREDPLGLLLEVDEIARAAPAELSGQITDLRDAVEGFRQGDESLINVVRQARQLQERCAP